MNKDTYLRLYLSEQEIEEFAKSNRYLTTHQDIIYNLGLSSHYYLILRRLFPHLPKRRNPKYRRKNLIKSKLATVDLLVIKEIDSSGGIFLEPPFWNFKNTPPIVKIDHSEILDEKLKIGDKILVRIKSKNSIRNKVDHLRANFLKIIGYNSKKSFGIVRKEEKGISILPTNKFLTKKTLVNNPYIKSLKDGDIVEIDIQDNKRDSKVITDNIQKVDGPSKKIDLFSFLSKKEFSLPFEFPDSVHKELSIMKENRKNSFYEDLTRIPFLTIDPIDAKDKDDAIYAVFKDKNHEEDVFCEIWIAISDVSSHVLAGSSIDQEALRRGNSTYFVDSAIPMLPNKISNDLCSLKENKVRNSITLKIELASSGRKITHKFIKSKISVKHNCSYEEVESIQKKSKFHKSSNSEKEQLFENLFKANSLLTKSMPKSMALNIPEPKFKISKAGDVTDLFTDKPLKSQKIVENFMIAANMCVAETLSESSLPVIYRVHENPTTESLSKLLKKTSILGIRDYKKRNIKTQDLNQILDLAKTNQLYDITSLLVLQSMSQAYYTTREIGHFGLNLRKYVHFTSPIRRYADLQTHRLLYLHLGWSTENSYRMNAKYSELVCQHASAMERNSTMAERKSNHRYIAIFMKALIGEIFEGVVYSSTKNLIFFFLRRFGIQGISHHKKYCKQDRKSRRGKHLKENKLVKIGEEIKVKLISVNIISGELSFEIE